MEVLEHPTGQIGVGESAPPARRARGRGFAIACALTGAVSITLLVGHRLVATDPLIHVNAPPFVGTWALQLQPGILWAVAVALLVVAAGPPLARRLSWPMLLLATSAASCAWSVALAASDGWAAVSAPLRSRYEYLAAVPQLGSPADFLRTFTADLSQYPTHVKGHPPGMVIVLWCLDALGLGGAGPAAALVLVVAASGGAAVLLAVRSVSGDTDARRLAPFLVLFPAAVWIATSVDGFFLGVGAWAVAALVLATSRRGRSSHLLAALGGVLFGGLALLSYGLVLLGAVPLAVAVVRHRVWPLVVAGATAAVVVALPLLAGFWWLDGLRSTRALQLSGVASRRPLTYFAIANLIALAVAVGPAGVAGSKSLWRNLRARPIAALVGGALVAVVIADVSGFSKGEVERIWLPFMPWLSVGAFTLAASRRWLAASAAAGIGIQVLLRTPW